PSRRPRERRRPRRRGREPAPPTCGCTRTRAPRREGRSHIERTADSARRDSRQQWRNPRNSQLPSIRTTHPLHLRIDRLLMSLYGIFTSASPADDKDTQPMTSAELDQVVVRPFERTQWSGAAAPGVGDDVAAALEGGDVVFLPRLRFEPSDAELALFSPGIVGASKNVG